MEDTSTASLCNKYRYRALQDQSEIRCLTLSAGTESDPLTCGIQHYNLSDNPSFEAVSYVWGSLIRYETITCDGRILYITPNLRRALQQVRLMSTDRVLWVDSICINQDDDKEKGHQVSLMAQIYSRTERVLITLGADKISLTHSPITDTLMRGVDLQMSRNWSWSLHNTPDHKILSDPRWESFDYLVSHPWFKRGWVVQEAALGRHVRVLWGSNSFNWNTIVRTCSWLLAQAPSSHSEIRRRIPGLHLDIYQRQHMIETRVFFPQEQNRRIGDTVLDLLCNARRLELTDKRDRIYAFIGLPGFQKLSRDLVIDYDKSWPEVYYDVAHWHIVTNMSLLVLHYVEHNRETLASDHPSWVPQWHTRQYTEILRSKGRDEGTLSHYSPPIYLYVTRPRILEVQGILLDTIEFTSAPFSSEPSTEEIQAVWNLWRQQNKRDAYKHFSSLLAFVNALLADKMIPGTARVAHINLRTFLQQLFGVESTQREEKFGVWAASHGDHARDVHSLISRNLINRRFAVTRRGCFGLVPNAAAEGDLYSILFGAYTPFVLRVTGKEGHYKLAGEGFLVSSQDTAQLDPFLYRVGSGTHAREDWVTWGLKEEHISLC